MVCLFFWIIPLASQGQDFFLSENLLQAHKLTLKLRLQEALKIVDGQNSAEALYIASLGEVIELLITEDNSLFSEYEKRFQYRLDQPIKSSTRDYQFLQAELRLHWAFVYLKFGHELDAALHLRQAYQIAEACKRKFPDYLPIKKTTGILEVIMGSIPEKYNWVLNLLNMKGSISTGLKDLEKIAELERSLSIEGKILHALVKGFILQQTGPAYADMKKINDEEKGNQFVLFLTASLAIKNSQSEEALEMLNLLVDSASHLVLPLHYADYLRGEVNLHKGDYLNAVSAYRWFINHHAGQNYKKDALFKIGLCYWLNGNENDALAFFGEARKNGKETTEADKSASTTLSEKDLPHIKLTKARYFTDGGYYQEAENMLSAVSPADLLTKRDQVEYYYRKARLAHKKNQADAPTLYQKTIAMADMEHWYFAPNSCLQLGYIFQSQNKLHEAKIFFERALSYKRHEYKNSIDSKARSALAQLNRR